MKLIETELKGVYIIENFCITDQRGSFVKTFNKEKYTEYGICSDFKESYFSISKKNVIRGMHFQIPPYDHEKLVYVARGEIIDVILDLRKNSVTYGKSISVVLSDENFRSVYIPKGFAHGFRALKDETITVYNVSTVYNKDSDRGIRFDSFDYDWNAKNSILSERDLKFFGFEEFTVNNPF